MADYFARRVSIARLSAKFGVITAEAEKKVSVNGGTSLKRRRDVDIPRDNSVEGRAPKHIKTSSSNLNSGLLAQHPLQSLQSKISAQVLDTRRALLPTRPSLQREEPLRDPVLKALNFNSGIYHDEKSKALGEEIMQFIFQLHKKTNFSFFAREATGGGEKPLQISLKRLPFTGVGVWNSNNNAVELDPFNLHVALEPSKDPGKIPAKLDVGRLQGTAAYEIINASKDSFLKKINEMADCGEFEQISEKLKAIGLTDGAGAGAGKHLDADEYTMQISGMSEVLHSHFKPALNAEDSKELAEAIHKLNFCFPHAWTGNDSLLSAANLFGMSMEYIGWSSAKNYNQIMTEATAAGVKIPDSAMLFDHDFGTRENPGLFKKFDNFFLLQVGPGFVPEDYVSTMHSHLGEHSLDYIEQYFARRAQKADQAADNTIVAAPNNNDAPSGGSALDYFRSFEADPNNEAALAQLQQGRPSGAQAARRA